MICLTLLTYAQPNEIEQVTQVLDTLNLPVATQLAIVVSLLILVVLIVVFNDWRSSKAENKLLRILIEQTEYNAKRLKVTQETADRRFNEVTDRLQRQLDQKEDELTAEIAKRRDAEELAAHLKREMEHLLSIERKYDQLVLKYDTAKRLLQETGADPDATQPLPPREDLVVTDKTRPLPLEEMEQKAAEDAARKTAEMPTLTVASSDTDDSQADATPPFPEPPQ